MFDPNNDPGHRGDVVPGTVGNRLNDDIRETVASLIPAGAEVFNNTSRALELIGVADDIERSGRYEPLRLRLFQMDREMRLAKCEPLPLHLTTSSEACTP